MKTHQKLWAAAALVTAISLSGCFGDDDDDPVVVTPPGGSGVPDTAGASAAAFFAYLLTLGTADESSEPLGISDSFAVPAEESSEPAALS